MILQNQEYKKRAINVLVIAAWMGVLAGIGEGLLFLLLQGLGRLVYANAQILWISTYFDLGLFLFAGLGIILLGLVFRKFPILPSAVFLFSFLTALDWIGLVFLERMYKWAIVIFAVGVAVTVLRSYLKKPATWMRFWKKSLPVGLGLALLIWVGLRSGEWLREQIAFAYLPFASKGAPNVLLVVIDTLRSDHLSSNGYSRLTTPNLDQIAAAGISFTNAYSTSSYSLTSHVSLLTGKNNFEHGVEWDNPKALGTTPFPTIAEILQEQGYRTGGFSANQFWVTREQGFNRGFLHFEDYFQTPGDFFVRPFFGRVFDTLYHHLFKYKDIIGRRDAADVNQSVLNWVEQKPEKPFFVFINYIDAHDPYLPPQPYRSLFSNQDNPGGILNNDLGRKDPQLSPEDLQGEIDAYDGAIRYVDDNIGRLVKKLEETTGGNLLVIITSDHGEAFHEHGTYLHGRSLYREEIHIPLLIYGPDQDQSGLRIDQPVSLNSLPATILELVSLDPNQEFSGSSLTSLWQAKNQPITWTDPLAEIAQRDWEPEVSPVYSGWIKSLVSPDWQFIEYQNRAPEIYSTQNDPLQTNNLAEQAEMSGILETFQAKLTNLLLRAKKQ